jgi:NAD(P)-dependent dehydrogenase (short-subunit alcohol dehydrogenase family)
MRTTERASKVVVITGTSSGFGLLTAVEVARRGHTVYATMRDLSRGSELERVCRSAELNVSQRRLDVTDQASIAAVIDEVLEAHGRVDVLVNNAGSGAVARADDLSDDVAQDSIDTNFLGAVRCTRAVAGNMKANGSGTIINVSSIAGRSAVPFLSTYTASKFALEGWSESLRYELGPTGIKVCVIEPGTFRTAIYGRDKLLHSRTADNPVDATLQRAEMLLFEHAARHGGDPAVVARRIADVVDRWTRFRVVIGRDARLELAFRRMLPDELFGRLMGRFVWRDLVGGGGRRKGRAR